MVKGYEFEKDRYVIFKPAELKALEEAARHTIDIVAFIPLAAVDPIYYDKAYYLAPDKRGAKPYRLLMEAMRESGRCALARWAWKGKQYVVQVRPGDDGLVLQQLLYADEVRSMKELDIEHGRRPEARAAARAAADRPDLRRQLRPAQSFRRGEAAHPRRHRREDRRQADRRRPRRPSRAGGQIIDLMDALRASLQRKKPAAKAPAAAPPPPAEPAEARSARAPKRAAARGRMRRGRAGPGASAQVTATKRTRDLHPARHPVDAGPVARRSSAAWSQPGSWRRAAARATSTASASRTWCCCARRTACSRRRSRRARSCARCAGCRTRCRASCR